MTAIAFSDHVHVSRSQALSKASKTRAADRESQTGLWLPWRCSGH
jgi:hypothetical protein